MVYLLGKETCGAKKPHAEDAEDSQRALREKESVSISPSLRILCEPSAPSA
jgi:hypothetical protein